MTKFLNILVLFIVITLFVKCNTNSSELVDSSTTLESNLVAQDINQDLSEDNTLVPNISDTLPKGLGHGYDFEGNGKQDDPVLDTINFSTVLDSLPLPQITKELKEGLRNQLRILRHAKVNEVKFDDTRVKSSDLKEVINTLLDQSNGEVASLSNFKAFQLEGEDGNGSVHFTGYFTPILEVRKQKDSIFQYPIYKYPIDWNGKLPSRQEIDEQDFLVGRDLEIAYANDLFSIYTMQVQGSGIVEFEDGQQKLLAFAGGNQHPYKSIGRYMIEQGYLSKKGVSLKRIKEYFDEYPEYLSDILNSNPSYVFFSPQDSKPIGAGNEPLTPSYSIAVDRRHIPLGAVLLASVPILDNNNEISHHEWRFVLAQDVGAAIKGPGHVDLYMGVGKEARRQASFLHHYGELWMILP